MLFAFEKTPCISLGCKLVPVQYRQYENGLLSVGRVEKRSRMRQLRPIRAKILACEYSRLSFDIDLSDTFRMKDS